jgi:hypothetical protein
MKKMAQKIWALALLALAIIVVSLVIQFGLEGIEGNAQGDSTSKDGPVISQRQPVNRASEFESAASRSRADRLNRHHPREVSPEHFPPALISKIVNSMRNSVGGFKRLAQRGVVRKRCHLGFDSRDICVGDD